MSQANQQSSQDESHSVPERAPTWSQLRDRAPYTSDVRDDPSGGVIVHRCHPDGEPEDFFAFAMRHETMRGYVDKETYLFTGSVENGEGRPSPAVRTGIGKWDSTVASFHFREGSHEDCAICQGTADPDELLRGVIDTATDQVGGDHNVARSGVYGEQRDGAHRAEVYLDSHGQRASGSKPAGDSENRPSMATSGPYDVNNSTRHWASHIVAHPYVQMAGAEEVGEGGNAHSPDNTLRITLKSHYPARGPTVEL